MFIRFERLKGPNCYYGLLYIKIDVTHTHSNSWCSPGPMINYNIFLVNSFSISNESVYDYYLFDEIFDYTNRCLKK